MKTNKLVAETIRNEEKVEQTWLSTGIRARLKPVPPRLLDDVVSRLVDPEPPMWHNDEYDRDEPNPGDAAYRRLVAENAHQRALAQIDVLIAFGVELLDDIPPDEQWLPNLKFISKITHQDLLIGVDLNDKVEKEFLYKKYIAVGNSDLFQLSKLAGLTAAEVDAAVKSFPGNQE